MSMPATDGADQKVVSRGHVQAEEEARQVAPGRGQSLAALPPTPPRNPLKLPPGLALTDIWGSLRPAQKRAWLIVVQREARAVAVASRNYRARTRRPLDLAGVAALAEREREAAARRLRELDEATSNYRVGRPRAFRRAEGLTRKPQ